MAALFVVPRTGVRRDPVRYTVAGNRSVLDRWRDVRATGSSRQLARRSGYPRGGSWHRSGFVVVGLCKKVQRWTRPCTGTIDWQLCAARMRGLHEYVGAGLLCTCVLPVVVRRVRCVYGTPLLRWIRHLRCLSGGRQVHPPAWAFSCYEMDRTKD